MKRTALSALLAIALVLGACASDDTTTTTAGDAATTTAAATAGATVAVASTDLGDILQDGEGRTLYLFNPDAQGDPTCYDDCADAWPALVEEVTAGDGADGSLLGTATRTDGGVQVTYNGWPLYYFSGDVAAGDTNGQGLNDVWWVVDPTGTAVSG